MILFSLFQFLNNLIIKIKIKKTAILIYEDQQHCITLGNLQYSRATINSSNFSFFGFCYWIQCLQRVAASALTASSWSMFWFFFLNCCDVIFVIYVEIFCTVDLTNLCR